MLKIRLQRTGRKNRAYYRVVVAEHSAPIQGGYVDLLGHFDPLVDKHGLQIELEKVDAWIKKGAKPTNTVARLLKGHGHKGMDPYIIEMKDKKVKNPKEEPVAEAPAAPEAAEQPVAAEEAPAPVAEEAPAPEVQEAPAEPAKEETPAAEEPKTEAAAEGEAPSEEKTA